MAVRSRTGDMSDPARSGFAITPHASTPLAVTTRGIWVGGTGTLKVTLVDMAVGTYITLSAIPAGTMLPLCAKLVHTDSTATLLIGLV